MGFSTEASRYFEGRAKTVRFTMMMSSVLQRAVAPTLRRRPLVLVATVSTRHLSDAPKKRSRVKKTKDKSGHDTSRSRDLEILLAALDAPSTKPPPVDDEEKARRERILKEYTIGKFKQHNKQNHDLSCKIKMKQHAIKMLPRHSTLKEEALKIDDDGPPLWRLIPQWTPPIPGFDPSQFVGNEE